MNRFLYLHGFASGPQSGKALFFQQRLAASGCSLEVPDLTEGDFENSTISQQLRCIERLIRNDTVVLLGSSMGGFLASLFAARHPARVAKLVLLAPAFGLARRWVESLDAETMRDWRERGWRTVYHYGHKQDRRISYALISDGEQYEDFPNVSQPTLVFHGRRDASVDYRLSEQFAAGRPNVELVLFDSDHQLLDVLEPMWERVRAFL
jgi:uncharacterized protein